jgi:hypothetical protein
MRQNGSFRIKSISLLLIFILLKLGVAHSLSHAVSHDDIDSCEHCILLIESNKNNAFDNSSSGHDYEIIVYETIDKPFKSLYKNPLFNDYRYSFFYNKPPPIQVL